jgi:hypothetical protein
MEWVPFFNRTPQLPFATRTRRMYRNQLQTIKIQLAQVSANQEALLGWINTLPQDERGGSMRKAMAAMYNSLAMLNAICASLATDVKT